MEREREEYNTAGIGKSTLLLGIKYIFNPFEKIGKYLVVIIKEIKITRFIYLFFLYKWNIIWFSYNIKLSWITLLS